jgi:hypothetical protein
MKQFIVILLAGFLMSCSSSQNFSDTDTDLTHLWDTVRPLDNPDKGWYHHLLDNGIGKYKISDERKLKAFPGMDHFYLRLAWAYLEPEEGKFDWSYIDDVVEKYVPQGYKISFRISCKETGSAPESVPVEIDGIRYATPYWVKQAGAKGVDRPEFGSPSWTPDWLDSVFLEKLDNFHRAFAEKYDGHPWVLYVDVGSIGEWGEGHTHYSTRIPPTVEEIKTHMDLHLKHYKKTRLVVTDDLLYWNKPAGEVQELLDYAISKGFTLRDDSPMVDWYIYNNQDTWSVSHPHFFEAVYKTRPTVFELQHYGSVKTDGNWIGKNGEEIIPGLNVSGADIFRNSMQLIRPTYIGYHGYLEEWLDDNPELTGELLNLCGYWFFPKSLEILELTRSKFIFSIDWLNKGVAPAYSVYKLKGKLIPQAESGETIHFEINDSGNRNWMPDEVSTENYDVELPRNLKGRYKLAVQLFDAKSERPVEIGLSTDTKEDGYFILNEFIF